MNFLAEIVARKLEDSLRLFEPGVAETFKAEKDRPRPAPVSLKAALDGAAGPVSSPRSSGPHPQGGVAVTGPVGAGGESTRTMAPRRSRS